MTKLLEYQGKQLLKAQGIAVPEGAVVSTPQEAYEVATLVEPVQAVVPVSNTGQVLRERWGTDSSSMTA